MGNSLSRIAWLGVLVTAVVTVVLTQRQRYDTLPETSSEDSCDTERSQAAAVPDAVFTDDLNDHPAETANVERPDAVEENNRLDGADTPERAPSGNAESSDAEGSAKENNQLVPLYAPKFEDISVAESSTKENDQLAQLDAPKLEVLRDDERPKTAAEPGTFFADVLNVYDGDTLSVRRHDGSEEHLRLAGIDAPELGDYYGPQARKTLIELLGNQSVQVRKVATDRYGWTIAQVTVDQTNVNEQMVLSGAAFFCPDSACGADYRSDQQRACQSNQGLWAKSGHTPARQCRECDSCGSVGPAVIEDALYFDNNCVQDDRCCTGWSVMNDGACMGVYSGCCYDGEYGKSGVYWGSDRRSAGLFRRGRRECIGQGGGYYGY